MPFDYLLPLTRCVPTLRPQIQIPYQCPSNRIRCNASLYTTPRKTSTPRLFNPTMGLVLTFSFHDIVLLIGIPGIIALIILALVYFGICLFLLVYSILHCPFWPRHRSGMAACCELDEEHIMMGNGGNDSTRAWLARSQMSAQALV